MWSDNRYVHVCTSLLHGDSHVLLMREGSEEGREERRQRDITRRDTVMYIDGVMYLYAIS